MMDSELRLQLEHAKEEARAVEQEFDAEPVSRREFRRNRFDQLRSKPFASVELDLRDILACAFAMGGAAPEEIYEAADAALKFRGE